MRNMKVIKLLVLRIRRFGEGGRSAFGNPQFLLLYIFLFVELTLFYDDIKLF